MYCVSTLGSISWPAGRLLWLQFFKLGSQFGVCWLSHQAVPATSSRRKTHLNAERGRHQQPSPNPSVHSQIKGAPHADCWEIFCTTLWPHSCYCCDHGQCRTPALPNPQLSQKDNCLSRGMSLWHCRRRKHQSLQLPCVCDVVSSYCNKRLHGGWCHRSVVNSGLPVLLQYFHAGSRAGF